jgi:transposase
MTRPYSEDLRERALLRADAGDMIREIATALQISVDCRLKVSQVFHREVSHP